LDFSFTQQQEKFRQEIKNFFESQEIQKILREIKSQNVDFDARRIYRLLGEQGLLAPNWSKEYGGLDKSFYEAAIVGEEMSNYGVPEALYILSVFIVGNLLNLSATDKQKQRFLKKIAKGIEFVTILYSEPKFGSDLSSIETKATLNKDGQYSISGRKVWSMKTHIADYGLCAARTSNLNSKYDGLTLFMVPLKDKAVKLNRIESLSDESLYEVILNEVIVSEEDIIGELNKGWSIMNKALSVERTGLDYYIRAKRWFNSIRQREIEYDLNIDNNKLIDLMRLDCKLDVSSLLTYKVLGELQTTSGVDESLAAISKWYASELACEVVWKGHELGGIISCLREDHGYNPLYGSLESAYRETPGLTLSAGTSEMLLQSISKFRLELDNRGEKIGN